LAIELRGILWSTLPRPQSCPGAAVTGPALRVVLGLQDGAIPSAVDVYLRECRARGLRAATIETYRWALSGSTVREWLDARSLTAMEDLTREAMADMLATLRERGLGAATVDDYRRTWRAFLRWAQMSGYIERAPAIAKGPRIESERRPLSAEEERRLIAACGCERDRIMLRFAIRTGLRLKELVALDLEDLEEIPGGYCVRVREEVAKSRRYRRVPLDTAAHRFSSDLARYIRDHRPRSPRRALWLTTKRDQRTGEYERLGRWAVASMFRRLGAATGIKVHPHMCRHTFATRALAAGVPELDVLHAGGWVDSRSLAPYVHHRTESMMAAWGRRQD